MPYINAYKKRKEKHAKIWREVFSEMHKSWEHTVQRYPDMEPQIKKLPDKRDSDTLLKKLPDKPVAGAQIVNLLNASGSHEPLGTQSDYPKRAAAGWAQYKSDAANRKMVLKDPNYQKWQKAMGVTAEDDKLAHPQSNWSFSQNNQFGYLYGRNPDEAYEFAKLVNAEYNNPPTMISPAAAVDETPVAEDLGVLDDIKASGGIFGYIGDVLQNNADLQASNSQAALDKGLEDAQKIQDILGGAAAR